MKFNDIVAPEAVGANTVEFNVASVIFSPDNGVEKSGSAPFLDQSSEGVRYGLESSIKIQDVPSSVVGMEELTEASYMI